MPNEPTNLTLPPLDLTAAPFVAPPDNDTIVRVEILERQLAELVARVHGACSVLDMLNKAALELAANIDSRKVAEPTGGGVTGDSFRDVQVNVTRP
ncbi:MAG: hypothetical protein JWP01_3391 [Myxococcales bacterium]|nr:hypothetical protein [Myxococcales bacterium]